MWEIAQFLSDTAARTTWTWTEEEHQDKLDALQEATGVYLTLKGPFYHATGEVLQSRRTAARCINRHPRITAASRPATREGGRRANPRNGEEVRDSHEVAPPEPAVLSNSDARSGNGRP